MTNQNFFLNKYKQNQNLSENSEIQNFNDTSTKEVKKFTFKKLEEVVEEEQHQQKKQQQFIKQSRPIGVLSKKQLAAILLIISDSDKAKKY